VTDPFAEQRLDGRVLVVTGSTQGLGAEIARRSARLGAAGIVICGRHSDRGEAVREQLEGLGAEAAFVEAQLEQPEPPVAVVRVCEERFGRLDGLVNAAGLSTRGTLDDTSVELWDRLFAVNVRAPFLLMQHAARLMRRGGRGGSIVNIITMSSHGGEPVLTAYSASKSALATLTRNAGYQLQPDRIRVNGLNIGWTATEGEHGVQTDTGQPADWLAGADASRPLGRLLRPDTSLRWSPTFSAMQRSWSPDRSSTSTRPCTAPTASMSRPAAERERGTGVAHAERGGQHGRRAEAPVSSRR
jgi:NAD(P)-dependent dehydrogenase (short-subunit alcohol dehydrogenase family)